MKKIKVIEKGPFEGYTVEAETNGRVKKVRCLFCGHKFSATFFRKDPDPNDTSLCPKCGEMSEFEWA
jgi:NAD-dependent SIR2 family protein deacetylase